MSTVPGYSPLPAPIDVPSTRAMTKAEAKACVQEIKGHIGSLRDRLLDLYERKGWAALGYASWRECVAKEFEQSVSYLYRQMQAGKIEKNISPIGEHGGLGEIPESQLRPMAAIPPEQQAEVWEAVIATAPDGKVTAEHVQNVVTAIKEESLSDKEKVARAKDRIQDKKTAKRDATQQALAEKGKGFQQERVGNVEIYCRDSRNLSFVEEGGIQLIITSPQYNVGMPYHVANDNLSEMEYAKLLQGIFAECFRVLCDGGRIAVVVPFGVGRDPWKPLASVVTDHLMAVGFTLRGQIVWHKGTFDTSTKWGSWQSPTNPVLKDTNEAIIICHKGQSQLEVPKGVLVHGKSTFLTDDFPGTPFPLLVTDFWEIPPVRVDGHPAPFPSELAKRLIRLFGYPGCAVLDPCAGSGNTGIAAKELGVNAVLVDVDEAYCELARSRLE